VGVRCKQVLQGEVLNKRRKKSGEEEEVQSMKTTVMLQAWA